MLKLSFTGILFSLSTKISSSKYKLQYNNTNKIANKLTKLYKKIRKNAIIFAKILSETIENTRKNGNNKKYKKNSEKDLFLMHVLGL